MSTTRSARAVGLFLDEAWAAIREGRYSPAVATAERAVLAAEQLGDPALLIRAVEAKAVALLALGDRPATLSCCTRILALAETSASLPRSAHRSVAQAYVDWVDAALYQTGIPVRELFGVLDAADRWLTATGHPDWRAGVLLMRAMVHRRLGDFAAAVATAEEALAAYRPGAPGTSRSGHRTVLGDLLRYAGRYRDAEPHYQAALDDPASSSHSRAAAHVGLAYCALGSGEAARLHAANAVSLAEFLGDGMLCVALDVSAAAARSCKDLEGAWQTATRQLEVAARVGGHYRLYYATLTAVDVALDRRDLDTARRLLPDLERHAGALDSPAGTTAYASDTARRRRRLVELDDADR